MKKRILSMLLVLSMVLAMVPAQVFATNTDPETIQAQREGHGFTDVEKGQWYYDYVTYVVENNLFSGISNTEFDPLGPMTRAMYVTVMGRIAEIDPADYPQSGFDDVPNDNWASPYVAWAKEKGITSGVGDGKFAPETFVTREQMAVFTVRFFDSYGIALPEATIDTQPKDLDSVSDFAKEASLKLWVCGLFQGNESGNFNPLSNTTRVEAAAFLSRTDEKVEAWLLETGAKEESTKPSIGHRQTYYTYQFVSNGGANISDRNMIKGGTLDNLPIPYKADAIFTGWYYDAGLTQLVETTDVATASATLYAKYQDTPALVESEQVPVAVSIDSQPDFTVTIVATETLTTAQLEALVEMENLSSQQDKIWFNITQSGNEFIISGYNYPLGAERQAGFVEGYAYKITLLDDGLSFKNQDPTSRVYDFTIARQEVMNLELNHKVTEIPYADISDLTVNGTASDSVYAPISIDADGNSTSNTELEGTFVYEKGDLEAGDTVAIYENTPPSQSTDTVMTEGKTGFVTILKKEGNQYTYKVAETKDVLFTPDVLPVKIGADQDENPDTITVPKSELTYIDPSYAEVGLNGETTIDVGDFMAFYEGVSPDASTTTTDDALYAEILSVEVDGDNYVIGYKGVTLAEMQTAMDVSKRGSVEGDILLSDANVVALEDDIARQAQESGFVDDAVMYLAALALETDSFAQVSDQYQLKTFEMQQNGQPITPETLQLMAGGSKPSISVAMPKVSISRTLKHFTNMPDYMKGVSATLEVAGAITFKFGADNDNVVKIDLKGVFEQEISVAFAAEADTDWGVKWGFLPWITACEVTAGLEFYNYTHIDVKANITTQEAGSTLDKIKIEDISDKVKDLLSQEGGDASKTVADGLAEQYAAMLENESAWVDIIDKEILKLSFNILYVVDIQVKASFVVAADMNIALGASFTYENAKRYIYYIDVFEASVTNNVIDLCPEHYVFEFYVMGALGLRAGIRLEFAVGIFSCDIASVGFGAEVGAYVRVWGYFYYKLEVTKPLNKPEEKHTQYSGALLFELGIYLKISFRAEVGGGKMSYTPTLFEDEWPLWTAGHQDNVLGFAYDQEDAPKAEMKYYFKTVQIPDKTFEMEYLDLKKGLDYDGTLFEAIYDDSKDFTITITNPAFSYDVDSNLITVSPDGDSVKEEGEMVIVWKNRPLAFSSAPIERRISLYWDNLQDGYIIVPYTNGGSYIPAITKKYEEAVTAPEDPTRAGYTFVGWFADKAMTIPYVFPKTMPKVNTEIYAKWEERNDTEYTVRHFGKTVGCSTYEVMYNETLQGTTHAEVTPAVRDFTGYTAPATKTTTILADGSRVVDYYYALQVHTVTFDPGEGMGTPVVQRLTYGATVKAPRFAKAGYTFEGWDKLVKTTMGAEAVTYTAEWTKNPPQYRVEYRVMQPDGRYATQEILFEQAASLGEEIVLDGLQKADYVAPDITFFKEVTVNGVVATGATTLAEDGSTVIRVYYDRAQYTATFVLDNGQNDVVQTLYVGQEIVQPSPTKKGYVFGGFGQVAETMGTEDLTYMAIWTPGTATEYTVKHVRQDLDGSYPASGELVETERKINSTTGQQTAAEVKAYTGFTAPSTVAQQTILGDGTTVVTIEYVRNAYPVKWDVDGDMTTTPVLYGDAIPMPEEPTKDDYRFVKWVDSATKEELIANTVMGDETRTFEAEWRELTDGEKDYILSFNTGILGETAPKSKMIRWEQPYGALPTLDIPGYTFAGWKVTENGNTYPISETDMVSILGNHTATADLTPIAYEMKFYSSNSYDPSQPARTVTGDYNTYVSFPVLNDTGYTLKGWQVRGSEEIIYIPSDGSAIQRKVPLDGESFDAIWEENVYTLTFDTKGGTPIEPFERKYYDETPLNQFVTTLKGYSVYCWMLDGTPNQVTSIHERGDTTVVAQWSLDSYKINYEKTKGSLPDTAARSYTIESDDIILEEMDTYRGYEFGGWYTTEDCREGTEVTGVAIEAGSVGERTFYAKWTPMTFDVTFHENLGGNNTETQSYTVGDYVKSLRANTFEPEGRTFAKWTTKSDGTGRSFKDRDPASADDFIDSPHLYAQWDYKPAYIFYDGEDIGGETANNPTEYTAGDAEIVLNPPSNIKEPYTFLGWFKDDGTQVTSIPTGTTGNISLTAKWSHPGEFSIDAVSRSTRTHTYQITRTLPKGVTQVTPGERTVYYRTVNGTAVGNIVPEKGHFQHVSSFVTFTSEDGAGSTKEIEVENVSYQFQYVDSDAKSYIASIYATGRVWRYFDVEMYKIVNSKNEEENNLIGEGVYRDYFDQTQARIYYIPDGFYTDFDDIKTIYQNQQYDVNKNTQRDREIILDSDQYVLQAENGEYINYPQIKAYLLATANANDFRYKIDFEASDNNASLTTILKYYVNNQSTPYTTSFQFDGTEKPYEDIQELPLDWYEIVLVYNATGEGDAHITSRNFGFKVDDTRAPKQVGLVPMAFGTYEVGDTIYLSVIYDEIVKAGSDVTLADIPGLSLKDVEYCGGEHTNVLVFKAIVTETYEVDNDTLVAQKPVLGTVEDACGNQAK